MTRKPRSSLLRELPWTRTTLHRDQRLLPTAQGCAGNSDTGPWGPPRPRPLSAAPPFPRLEERNGVTATHAGGFEEQLRQASRAQRRSLCTTATPSPSLAPPDTVGRAGPRPVVAPWAAVPTGDQPQPHCPLGARRGPGGDTAGEPTSHQPRREPSRDSVMNAITTAGPPSGLRVPARPAGADALRPPLPAASLRTASPSGVGMSILGLRWGQGEGQLET